MKQALKEFILLSLTLFTLAHLKPFRNHIGSICYIHIYIHIYIYICIYIYTYVYIYGTSIHFTPHPLPSPWSKPLHTILFFFETVLQFQITTTSTRPLLNLRLQSSWDYRCTLPCPANFIYFIYFCRDRVLPCFPG